jgi:FlaA1/EpsC-like NDP-sugar epimerase
MSYFANDISPENFFQNSTVLITGACGTVGRNLALKLIQYNLGALHLLDLDDTKLTVLNDELEEYNNVKLILGDIREKERIFRALKGVDFAFHCAALKHVAIGEQNPHEVVLTNLIGTHNIVEASLRNKVKKVVFTSSDKAVNPVSTMGASKLLGEKIITAAHHNRDDQPTVFACIRFGNILGSRGDIICRFKKRIEKNVPLSVTNLEMARFAITTEEAVQLLLKSMITSIGGEIFVPKMLAIVLKDLVEIVKEYAFLSRGVYPQVNVVGASPGEKDYELLMTETEAKQAIEIDDMYIILPSISGIEKNTNHQPFLDLRGKLKTHSYQSNMSPSIPKKKITSIVRDLLR